MTAESKKIYCKDFCTMHAKLEADLENVQKLQESLAADKKDSHEIMWKSINSKTEMSTFKWIVGIVFVLLMTLLGFMWSMSQTISQTNIAVIELKANLDARTMIVEEGLKHLLETKKK